MDPGLLAALIAGFLGLAGIVMASKLGTTKEQRAANRSLEAKCRSLEDYANVTRGALRAAGQPVPPWPEELREVTAD